MDIDASQSPQIGHHVAAMRSCSSREATVTDDRHDSVHSTYQIENVLPYRCGVYYISDARDSLGGDSTD